MANVTRETVWLSGQILTASALNGEFNNLLNALDIVNADIAAGANIDPAKINATFPATGLLVGTTDSQTLTNKTLTSPTINTPIINQGITLMGAQAVDGTQASNIYTRLLAGSEVFTQSGFSTGRVFIVKVQQGSGQSYTVTWFSGVTWITSGGTAPVQTTTSSGYTTYGFVCTGTNTFDGYLVATQ